MAMSTGKRSIISMSAEDAKAFLLKQESYCTIDLPPYFVFNNILQKISGYLDSSKLSDCITKPGQENNVNHKIISNKDGKYGWRPLELCHPLLYVNLVHQITNESNWDFIINFFKESRKYKKIQCLSLPVESLTKSKDKAEQILSWWSGIEQKSIELAMDFNSVIHTDITDCYGAIYTHSIVWALHGKQNAKKNQNDRSLIGNLIDNGIQDMQQRQTNGIPQGSILMDFIAEMVLGYADVKLADKIDSLKIKDFKILRYRDDYRIFVNNSRDGDRILKSLTEVLFDLGLKLNPSKTRLSSDVIQSSVKKEKLVWIIQRQNNRNLQKHLLIIHDHASKHTNAGSLIRALQQFSKRIKKPLKGDKTIPLISIVVDIAYHNPRTYPVCMLIISKLLGSLNRRTQVGILTKIKNKFSTIPNIGYLELWLQRLTLPIDDEIIFHELLCQLASGEKVNIWNSKWVKASDLKRILRTKIVDRRNIESLTLTVALNEIQIFGEYE